MRLSASFGLISDLRAAFGVATLPTLKAICHEPSLVLRPTALSRTFMAAVWAAFAAPTDEGARPAKLSLISPHAIGAVLDIGAGLGHSIDYFDRSVVTAYIALEPNASMHKAIRARAAAAGFTEAKGTLFILGCGAEDTTIRAQLDGAGLRVDTILSIMTLCSIPDPERTLARLVRDVLSPGGRLLFYEHVLSPRADVAWWQRFWTPVWRLAFDGCCLDRPTHLWIEAMEDASADGTAMTMWGEQAVWGKEGEPDEHLFWHRVGRFVKHTD
ncbi:S-adenosyl-L-methionine-dependent methyltransferase [Mycena crocata]|nr:S-adenosyl-L-methionine-dependent methyltransferase [Mycena crocata]